MAFADVVVPPSEFVTVTLYAPAVAGSLVTLLVGVRLKLNEVAVLPTTGPTVRDVPFTALTTPTVGEVAVVKPVPVMVTVVGPLPSLNVEGETRVMVGAALTVKAVGGVEVPLESLRVRVYDPGVVAAVDAKFAEAALDELSAPLEKVRPGAVEAMVTVPPLLANPAPLIATVPDAPWPKNPAPPGVKVAVVTEVAAPATLGRAMGRATAKRRALAASALVA
jgi:hypothetical protein